MDATRKLIEFERECPNPSTEVGSTKKDNFLNMLKNVLQYSFKSLSFHAWIRLSNQGKKEGCRV